MEEQHQLKKAITDMKGKMGEYERDNRKLQDKLNELESLFKKLEIDGTLLNIEKLESSCLQMSEAFPQETENKKKEIEAEFWRHYNIKAQGPLAL